MPDTWEAALRKAVAAFGLPCANRSYGGKKPRYLVFNARERPTNFADDMPQHKIIAVQLHLFTNMEDDTTGLCAAMEKALAKAGFTYPQVIDVSDAASDEEKQHIVFEFETTEAVEV